MENIREVTDHYGIEHVIIDRGNGEFTSMTKAHYEAMQETTDPLAQFWYTVKYEIPRNKSATYPNN